MKQNFIKGTLLLFTLVLLSMRSFAASLYIQNTSLTNIQYSFTPGFAGMPGFPPFTPPMPGIPSIFSYRAQPYTIPFPDSIDLTDVDTLVITWTSPEGQKFVITPPTDPSYTNSTFPALSFGATYDGGASNLPPVASSSYSWSGLSGSPIMTSKSDYVSPNYITLGYRFLVNTPISFTSFTETITFSNNAAGTFTLDNNSYLTYSASSTLVTPDPYPATVTPGFAFVAITIPTITAVPQRTSGNNFSISWNATPGSTYRLQSTPTVNPGQAIWTDVPQHHRHQHQSRHHRHHQYHPEILPHPPRELISNRRVQFPYKSRTGNFAPQSHISSRAPGALPELFLFLHISTPRFQPRAQATN